jgi:hypothetical protein
MEYYLGTVGGAFRFICVLITALALLNARNFTQQEVSSNLAAQRELYGSAYFPSLASVQSTVFEESIAGRNLKQYGSKILIAPTSPEIRNITRRQLDDFSP